MEARGEVLMGEKSHRERLIGPIIMLHSPSYPGGGISALLDSGDLAKYIRGAVVVLPRHIPVCIMAP